MSVQPPNEHGNEKKTEGEISEPTSDRLDNLTDIILEFTSYPTKRRLLDAKQKCRLFDNLVRELSEASVIFKNGEDHGRAGIRLSLLSIWRMLIIIQITEHREGVTAPIRGIINALDDLACGAVSPLFAPKPAKGRPFAANSWQLLQALAAGTSMFLMKMGRPANAADGAVAEALDKLNLEPAGSAEGRGSRRIGARTVRGWREKVREDMYNKRPETMVARFAETGRPQLTAGATQEQIEKAALIRLAEMAKALRVQDSGKHANKAEAS